MLKSGDKVLGLVKMWPLEYFGPVKKRRPVVKKQRQSLAACR